MLKALVGRLEPRLVFFPYKGEDADPGTLGLRHQTVSLTTSDGERLVAWQIEPEQPRADIVSFHGTTDEDPAESVQRIWPSRFDYPARIK